jgi:N-acyl-L-homoserine lactone synthetase
MPEHLRLRAQITTKSQNPVLVDQLQVFRRQLFVDRLGWNLNVEGGREIDQFDTDSSIHCIVYAADRIVAGFRATCTIDDYLAAEIFPQLATIRPYPRRRNVWEISRFGVDPDAGYGRLALINYALMFRFAQLRQASGLVAIADLTYERYLRQLGIRTRRYGPPQTIGQDASGQDLVCVAGEIPLTDQPEQKMRFFSNILKKVEIHDEALVRRPERVSA